MAPTWTARTWQTGRHAGRAKLIREGIVHSNPAIFPTSVTSLRRCRPSNPRPLHPCVCVPRAEDKGFRTAPLIRLIGAEDGLLSHTHDSPRVFFNLEDYLVRSRASSTQEQQQAIAGSSHAGRRAAARPRARGR
jgi:hypothetical protein